jgi:hypothetical protein
MEFGQFRADTRELTQGCGPLRVLTSAQRPPGPAPASHGPLSHDRHKVDEAEGKIGPQPGDAPSRPCRRAGQPTYGNPRRA